MKPIKYIITSGLVALVTALSSPVFADEKPKNVPVAVVNDAYFGELAIFYEPESACFWVKDSVTGVVKGKKGAILLACDDGKMPCTGKEKEYDEKTLLKLVEGEAYYTSYFGNGDTLNKIYHCINGKAEGEQLFWDIYSFRSRPLKHRWHYSQNKVVEKEAWYSNGQKNSHASYDKDGKVIKGCSWNKEGKYTRFPEHEDFCKDKNNQNHKTILEMYRDKK